MSSLLSYLPGPGLLPSWMLLVSTAATFNIVQNYVTDSLTKRVYGRKPEYVTPLTNRLFATWTLASTCIRLYAASDITNPALYNLAYASYIIAFLHFIPEMAIFGTCKIDAPWLSPVLVASTSLIWMTLQRGFYLG